MIVRVLLVVFGLVEFLFPKRLVDTMMEVATTDESEVEFRSWVYTAARIEGLIIIMFALRRSRRTSSEDDE